MTTLAGKPSTDQQLSSRGYWSQTQTAPTSLTRADSRVVSARLALFPFGRGVRSGQPDNASICANDQSIRNPLVTGSQLAKCADFCFAAIAAGRESGRRGRQWGQQQKPSLHSRLGTMVEIVPQHITFEAAAKALRDCDLIFGCTDKELPRAILGQLAVRYCIPIFDLGVLIDSRDGCIAGVHGRVTTLMPGEACLFCRGRITAEGIRIESLSAEDRERQVRDGYAPGLDEPAPAVIAFTTATASAAIIELLHRLTGFMGSERNSSEVLLALDQTRLRTNRLAPREGCVCEDRSFWGRGDVDPFLEMVWPNETR